MLWVDDVTFLRLLVCQWNGVSSKLVDSVTYLIGGDGHWGISDVIVIVLFAAVLAS